MAFRLLLLSSLFAISMAQVCRDAFPSAYCRQNKRVCKIHPGVVNLCKKTCGLCGVGPVTDPPRPPRPTGRPTDAPPPPRPSGPPPACGRPAFAQSRVVAGEDAKPGAWPWQIALKINGRFGCGGSLVSPNWVVTAAHCVDRIATPWSYQVIVGAHDRRRREPSAKGHSVSEIIIHPKWGRLNYDIALLKLSRPAELNSRVRTVCLPDGSAPVPVGTKCFITGWGKIKHPGSSHPILQQADLPVISRDVCQKLNSKKVPITISDVMVCAGHGPGNPKSGCHGDSGGPFVCATGPGGAFELHGAVSWGSARCNSNESYTVFARVTALRSWIRQHTGL